MKPFAIICLLSAALLPLPGCDQYTTPIAPSPMTGEEKQFQAVWEASQEVLRKYEFDIDRRDPREGILTTELQTGKQWFEFWRHDSVTAFDVAESTVQTLYRWVEVQVSRQTFDVKVIVHVYRTDRREPQVTSVSDAYDLFLIPGGHKVPTADLLLNEDLRHQVKVETQAETQPATAAPTAPPDWMVPVGEYGRDFDLEKRLSAEIRGAAAAWRAGH